MQKSDKMQVGRYDLSRNGTMIWKNGERRGYLSCGTALKTSNGLNTARGGCHDPMFAFFHASASRKSMPPMQAIVKIAKYGIRTIFTATWYFWFPVIPAQRGRIIFRNVCGGLLIHYCHPIVTEQANVQFSTSPYIRNSIILCFMQATFNQ